MIRKRTTTHANDDSVDAVDVSSVDDDRLDRRHMALGGWRQPTAVVLTALISCCVVILLAIADIDSKSPSNLVPLLGSASLSSSVAIVAAKKWSSCNSQRDRSAIKPMDNPQEANRKLEPLWLPAYPTSLPGKNGDIFSGFLSKLTGVDAAARNYYRSSKTLKRCHTLNNPDSIGVTCEIVHPIVPCERPHPSSQSDNFGKVVLVAIRNPTTAFPAYHQEKAEKYHNAKGQVKMEEWISFRDQYVGNATHSPLFEEWKHFIMEWRNMNPYKVALYLPYERWSDEIKGPAFVKRLSEVIENEGFPLVYDGTASDSTNNPNDLECMWFKQVRETMQSEDKRRTDENWYVPDYTTDQKQMLAHELEKFAKEIASMKEARPGDEELVGILHEYRDSIRVA